jgi:hypothetical protein
MAMYALLVVTVPTILMALWAQPKQHVDMRVSSAFYFVLPAAFFGALIGLLFYVGGYSFVVNNWANYDVSPEQIQAFEEQLGYTLTSEDLAIASAANLVGRSAMTAFLVLVGLILINFVLPPFDYFAVYEEKVKQKRMLMVSIAMVGVYAIVVVFPPLRRFYEVVVLRPTDYLLIVLGAIMWTVVTREFLKRDLLRRFLQGGY